MSVNDGDAQLSDLWARRGDLSEREWGELYQRVMAALASGRNDFEQSLAGGHPKNAEELRHAFFVHKIATPALLPGYVPRPQLSAGGVRAFYFNFLRDEHDRRKRRPEQQLPHDNDARMADPAAEHEACEARGHRPGFDRDALEKSARKFLRKSEYWVVLYLALHFCHGRERLPLSKIQYQYQIPSYHYKAKLLGIAPPRGGYTGFAGFSKTMLGRWLADNAIPLQEDKMDIIRSAFDVLCFEAFKEFDRRELQREEEQQ
ncbi:MAG: hypothetical protein LC637_09045 [Xanthomonadaceae bacterium]|nr:hypothetical protein [Xanthomonadaceae bacterium]